MVKTLLFPIFCTATLLVNCASTAVYRESPQYQQQVAPPEEPMEYNKELAIPQAEAVPAGYREESNQQEIRKKIAALEEKKSYMKTASSAGYYDKRYKEDDVAGYIDNPTPVYIKELQESNSYPSGSGKSIAAMQQLAQISQMKQKGQTRPERLITYDASITTRSPRPDSIIEHAISLTSSVKGYVEARSNASVTLRIPSALFDTVFNALLKSGEIVDFRKSAEDITDAFQDANLRIQILNKTIQRYLKLVNQVKDESEKLKLLKEIEKLREQLENLEVRKKTLALRAEYAKIIFSVMAVTPQGRVALNQEIRGFEWVHWLDPFKVRSLGKRLDYDVPEGMVRIKSDGLWFVESADGAKVWSSLLPNKPEGSAKFWSRAVCERLKAEYNAVDTSSNQGFEFIKFTPYPGSAYVYYIAISADNDHLRVVQAYFPDEKQEKRYLQALRDILGRQRS